MTILLKEISNGLGIVLGFVVGLIPLIIVHEFGHLLMAKLVGVWAREFGIGFPPRLIKLFRWHETQFTLNLLPFGGFVQLEGEQAFAEPKSKKEAGEDTDDVAEELPSEDQDTFGAEEIAVKEPGVSAQVIASEEQSPLVTEAPVEKQPSPAEVAEEAGVHAHSLYAKSPEKRTLIYLGGPLMNMLVAWLLAVVVFVSGIPVTQVVIEKVQPASPAAGAGLQVNDLIVALNGEKVEEMDDVSRLTKKNLGQPVQVTVEREGQTLNVSLVPRVNPPKDQGAMGIEIGLIEKHGELKRYPPGQAFIYGTRMVRNLVMLSVMLPVYIIRGLIPIEQARPVGVIGISQIAQQSVERSITAQAAYPLLYILIFISVSLGIFNLLPIPALDGGRILFNIVEKIRGKPLSPALEEYIHTIALFILIVIFIFITILDIVAPIKLP